MTDEIITHADREAIRSAIQQAEKQTSAEVFAVLARRSGDYRHAAAYYLAMWIFVFAVLLALWARWQNYTIDPLVLTGAALAAFVFNMLIMWFVPRFAVLLTPSHILREHAHRNASHQFLAHGVHHTEGRSGVLVFISLEERFAEIVVDGAIEEKCGREPWLDLVEGMTERCADGKVTQAYLFAIAGVARELSGPFPPGRADKNELDDKLVFL